jgi:hypothetical protein
VTLTDGLALYAAVLSTVIFGWEIVRARPKVKVALILGDEGSGENARSGVYIFVRNPSSSPVHVTNISVLYPFQRTNLKDALEHMFRFRRLPLTLGWTHSSLHFHDVEHGCPVSVEPGKAHQVFMPDSVVEDLLKDAVRRELRAVAQDQLWNNAYSPVFTVPERVRGKRT